MDLSLWDAVLLICKLGIYLGFAAAVGGITMSFVLRNSIGRSLNGYLWTLTILALLSTVLAFFIQVGSLANSGIRGMWHPLFRDILWNASVGESTWLRVVGFTLMLIALATFRTPRKKAGAGWFRLVAFTLWVIALHPLAFSFALVGHTVDLGILAQLALGLHILAIGWWIGALWPLWYACKTLDSPSLQQVMIRFGQLAVYAVALLIAAGLFLATQLVSSVSELWSTDYGRILSVKLLGVAAILSLALFHKMRLVPALSSDPKGTRHLSRSIQIEMVLAFLILLATAVLTTLVGPGHAI